MSAPPNRAPVLIAGGTGFVGRPLLEAWRAREFPLRILSRRREPSLPPGVESWTADLRSDLPPAEAFEGVRLAYYLVHSLGRGTEDGFAAADRRAADNFAAAASRAGLERIIYLGGLGEGEGSRSAHLRSRSEVADRLKRSGAAVTVLRSGVVLGNGGSSFEMLVQLVERLPVMVCPRWVSLNTQPIARTDLVQYLLRAGEETSVAGLTLDVGGPEVVPYWRLMQMVGDLLGRRPWIVLVPWLTPSLSSHWVGLITRVPSSLARPLVDGLYEEAVCRDRRAERLLPFSREPLELTLQREIRQRYPPAHRLGRVSPGRQRLLVLPGIPFPSSSAPSPGHA